MDVMVNWAKNLDQIKEHFANSTCYVYLYILATYI